MKIIDKLNQGRLTLSFEVFPPKDNSNYERVRAAALDVARLNPLFVSVTYGAAGGASAHTLDIASAIKSDVGVECMAHLTCIGSGRDAVQKQLADLNAKGIENIMALRGDIPEGYTPKKDSYSYAVELIRDIKESGFDFGIGGACYPECHPESKNQAEDIKFLKEKVDAGLDFLTTQMVFDNNLFFNFMYKIREAGITVPVIPGIMPITNANQIKRAIKLSGAFVPVRFLKLVDKFGGNPNAMRQAGIAYATDQIIDLYANGIKNVHVYTMNNPFVAEQIQKNLSSILG